MAQNSACSRRWQVYSHHLDICTKHSPDVPKRLLQGTAFIHSFTMSDVTIEPNPVWHSTGSLQYMQHEVTSLVLWILGRGDGD